jgi:ABC-type multidrug transport system fused ATPase/permease subunit
MIFWKIKEFNIVYSQIKDRQKLYFGILGALISAGITAFIPYIYGRLVDIAIAPNSQVKIILGLIFLWLILSLLGDGLNRLSNRYAYEIATDVSNNLIVNLFHHLLSLPLKFHKEKKMGKVMRRAERGIDELSNLIERTIFSFLPAVISLIIALIILLFVEWRLSLILVVASLCYILITFIYTQKIIKKQRIMHRSWERAYGDLWDSVLNVQTVKSAAAEEFEQKGNTKNFNFAGKIYKD